MNRSSLGGGPEGMEVGGVRREIRVGLEQCR